MRSQRTIKTLSILASLGLLVGAYAVPAEAAKKKKKPFSCAPATATPPAEGHSSNAEEASEAEVVNLTAANTEEKPLVIEYEHGPAADPVMEDTKYFAFQVVSKTPGAGVYILQEWGGQSDIDLYLTDASGAEVASSGAFNPIPVALPGATGGPGYESISGYAADPCSPYTIESKGYLTMGEDMTVKLWLGEVVEEEE